mmetsp:Transcript_33998/g.50762  ORF Transcript_33998/g.50762 Transcript_33998/m.50762 type:complete len:124 (-) Transcript_33998:93-464(-)
MYFVVLELEHIDGYPICFLQHFLQKSGALTPTMLARRIRASEFSGLLDWKRLDLTEGLSIPNTRWSALGVGSTVAFVNAAMFFGDGVEPYMIQFSLRKIAGVWLIDDALINKTEWFVDDGDQE